MPDHAAQPSATRNLYSFGLTSFFNDTATEMAYWVLPAFLVSLGAGPAQLGVIEGIAESVASFAKLFSGYLADRIERRKPTVVAGYFVANAVKPLLAIVITGELWKHFGASLPFYVSAALAIVSAGLLAVSPSQRSESRAKDNSRYAEGSAGQLPPAF